MNVTDRCLECGFDYGSVTPAEAPPAIRAFPPAFRRSAGRVADDVIRIRPGPWTWSALEYLCHVRDVLAVYTERVNLVLRETRPTLASMRRDERALEERYNDQELSGVLEVFRANAESLADVLDSLDEPAWERSGVHPATGERSILWMAANVMHEGRHHLQDLDRVLDAVSSEA